MAQHAALDLPAQWRPLAAAAAVVLAAVVLWLPFQWEIPSYSLGARIVHIGLPSLLVLVAFGLLAWRFLPPGAAAAAAALAYLAMGLLLALAEVAYIGAAFRGGLSLLAFVIWPSLVLIQIGRWIGLVPLPE